MNDLSNAVVRDPVPGLAVYVLVPLLLIGLSVSLFILIVVHNVAFFLCVLIISAIVTSFIVWNRINWNRKTAISLFLRGLPDSDLALAHEGQLVKITGLASCGSVSLESSYEKAARCIYTSTCLYEYRGFNLSPANFNKSCFRWSLAYCERFCSDFFITDRKSGIRAVVKAGSGCNVIPLIVDSKLVTTTRRCRVLSAHMRKWLAYRNLRSEGRLLRLEEGYVREGSSVSVFGMLRRNDNVLMIVQPPEIISTGCLCHKLLLPSDVDGLILGVPDVAAQVTNTGSIEGEC
ncbi:hypothetical protein HS088_TW17G00821 [Tripterygium wilfordii]|uniref:Ubiquitin-specific protease family C19-related protein n=1 Tax=Tripterygium wilfordii TaxID=458696 RepID=A0A7J7CGX1_TRIWF|nr:uncharacterized membrane protein At1g16860-like [Tripterygium wilfordii]KAF5733279.1 hypothetical protein HS088_TW17G00821 [Tripterygium wilfordii]